MKLSDPAEHYRKQKVQIERKHEITFENIIKGLNGGSTVLDLGAGKFGSFNYRILEKFKRIGLDLSFDALKENDIKYELKTQGDARCLPLDNNCVHIVISRDCLEHISEIELVFSELRRVMKKNSLFVTQIPNLLYYSSILSFILPHTTKEFFKCKLLGINKTSFPVYYKINTSWHWRRFARKYDFKIESIEFFNSPSIWFIKFPVLYWLHEAAHKVFLLPIFRIFRSSMFVIAKYEGN